MSDRDKIGGFTNGDYDAEANAVRLLLAALEGGVIKLNMFSTDAGDGEKLAEFLGKAATSLAKKLRAG